MPYSAKALRLKEQVFILSCLQSAFIWLKVLFMRKGGVGMDHPDSRHIESMSKDQIDASDRGDPDPRTF